MIKKLIDRVVKNWQTSLLGILLVVGFELFRSGKIDFADFREYLILIPTIVLMFMKDWKSESK